MPWSSSASRCAWLLSSTNSVRCTTTRQLLNHLVTLLFSIYSVTLVNDYIQSDDDRYSRRGSVLLWCRSNDFELLCCYSNNRQFPGNWKQEVTGKASPNKRRQKKMSDCAYSALLPFVTLLKGRKEGRKEGRCCARSMYWMCRGGRSIFRWDGHHSNSSNILLYTEV